MPFYDKGLSTTAEDMVSLGDKTMFDLMRGDSDTTEEMLKTGEKTLLEAGVVEQAVAEIRKAERMWFTIAPEGTRRKL